MYIFIYLFICTMFMYNVYNLQSTIEGPDRVEYIPLNPGLIKLMVTIIKDSSFKDIITNKNPLFNIFKHINKKSYIHRFTCESGYPLGRRRKLIFNTTNIDKKYERKLEPSTFLFFSYFQYFLYL